MRPICSPQQAVGTGAHQRLRQRRASAYGAPLPRDAVCAAELDPEVAARKQREQDLERLLCDTSCWVHPAQMVNDNLHRNGLEPLLQARDVGTIEMKLDEPAQGRNAAHHMIEYGRVNEPPCWG